jgi:putative oxidoreductase
MGDIALAIARVAIPIVFIVSGIAKFLNVAGIANHPGLTNFMNAFGEITSRTTLGYIIAAIEVVGGISVLIGFKARWGAIALLLFTACTIIFAHNFWTMEGARPRSEPSAGSEKSRDHERTSGVCRYGIRTALGR